MRRKGPAPLGGKSLGLRYRHAAEDELLIGSIRHVGLRGLSVVLPSSVEVGDHLEVELSIGEHRRIHGSATIAGSAREQEGVWILELDEHVRAMLNLWLKKPSENQRTSD